MFRDPKGPIQEFTWGRYVIDGQEHAKTDQGRQGKGKDIRLIGNKVTRWKERKGHRLTPDMITGVYDQDIEVLVIGIGVHGCVECPGDVLDSIRRHGIDDVRLEPTPQACQTYNTLLRQGKHAALLAHGTC